jgi:uracil-DNA glycosylase
VDLTIPGSWKAVVGAEFEKPYFKSLAQFLDDERQAFPSQIYPREDQVFAALNATPFENVNAVILGQDPYPGEGMAHGLCFSVTRATTKLPPSLRNILKELQNDVGCPIPRHGCLESWATQGVLLLNTILTLRAGQPLSHRGRGWEIFTDEVLRVLNARPDPIAFVLWGRPAQSKIALIDAERHTVIQSAHPSPLSARAFFGTKPFTKINTALRAAGKPEIDWRLPDF